MELGLLSYQKQLSFNWNCNHSFDDLPDGLVLDILSRLPVKTIVQSTCVCKSWYSIIKSGSFISTHLSRSISNSSNYYIFVFRIYSTSVPVLSDNHLLTRHPDVNFPVETQCTSRTLIGACNGLLCLTDSSADYNGHDIYLINPFIYKYKKLVVQSSCYADLIGEIDHNTGYVEVSFGYSEVENDYKVVRIIDRYADTTRPSVVKVEIYSLKSGTWKALDVSNDMKTERYVSPVFVHGCLYHLRRKDGYLLCFNLKDEVFSRIDLPVTYHNLSSTWHSDICAKNGSVAVVLYNDPDMFFPCMRICVLMMEKNFDGQFQWKEFNYEYEYPDFIHGQCIGFSAVGRLIFEVSMGSTDLMVAVDLDNSCTVEKLELDFTDGFDGATNVMESLVLFSD